MIVTLDTKHGISLEDFKSLFENQFGENSLKIFYENRNSAMIHDCPTLITDVLAYMPEFKLVIIARFIGLGRNCQEPGLDKIKVYGQVHWKNPQKNCFGEYNWDSIRRLFKNYCWSSLNNTISFDFEAVESLLQRIEEIRELGEFVNWKNTEKIMNIVFKNVLIVQDSNYNISPDPSSYIPSELQSFTFG